MSDFGKNVYKYRKLAGMSQQELADVLGYKSKASIGKIENGNNEVLISMAMRIADALGVDIMLLIHGEKKQSDEFSYYLDRAEAWQLEAVRKILDMPEKKMEKSASAYTVKEELRG